MSEFKYRFYCFCHNLAKKNLRKSKLSVGNILEFSHIKTGFSNDIAVNYWKMFIKNASIPEDVDFIRRLYCGMQ